jgi:hypothetical protein
MTPSHSEADFDGHEFCEIKSGLKSKTVNLGCKNGVLDSYKRTVWVEGLIADFSNKSYKHSD